MQNSNIFDDVRTTYLSLAIQVFVQQTAQIDNCSSKILQRLRVRNPLKSKSLIFSQLFS